MYVHSGKSIAAVQGAPINILILWSTLYVVHPCEVEE